MPRLIGVTTPKMPRRWTVEALDEAISLQGTLWFLLRWEKLIKPLHRALKRSHRKVIEMLGKYLPDDERGFRMLKTALDEFCRKSPQDCVAAFLRYIVDHDAAKELRAELINQITLLGWLSTDKQAPTTRDL